jgi:4-nitrophenyl phosphatase
LRGLILDMDGVLWQDTVPIGDLPAIFRSIRARGLRVVLATNNATKTVDQYLEKLAAFSVELEAWQIVTSSNATAETMAHSFPGRGPVFVVGESGLVEALRRQGFSPIVAAEDETRPVAVVASIDRAVSYDKLSRATLHIRAGIPFYGTNPDKTFPTPQGLVPGAGAILAALQAATDVVPTVVGKPSPLMMQIALERLGLRQAEVIAVGDRLETDIAAGQAAGLRTALVLSGVSTAEQAGRWTPAPDLIAPGLAALLGT